MSDWADNIGDKIASQPCLCEDCVRLAVAIVVRKAKADGVRLAADEWTNPIYTEFKKGLLKKADEIEAGQ